MRGHERDREEQLSSPENGSGDSRRASPIADDASSGRMRQIRERERPEPSSVWLNGAFTFVTFAVGAVTAALTLSADAAIQPSELWVASGAFVFAAALCLVAHWDVNRGRKTKQREIEEVSEGRPEGR
jgi:hypothetical protein